jgi:hypothetical protein
MMHPIEYSVAITAGFDEINTDNIEGAQKPKETPKRLTDA